MTNQRSPLECRLTQKGAEYRGHQSFTVSYRACQRWTDQTPHAHGFRHAWMFPDPEGVHVSLNFCRNPGGVRDEPWCFTSDPRVEWELCNVPLCGCRMTRAGDDYVGGVSRTLSGRRCQRWDSQHPHAHSYASRIRSPNSAAMAGGENFCRNPDPSDATGPWCFTTDPKVRWEYCDIPFCECRFTIVGTEYAGRISQTRTGRQCQRWISQSPHPHNFTDVHLYPDDRLEDAANYCRNPNPQRHPEGPWCLTADRRQPPWEQCDISFCEGAVEEGLSTSSSTSTEAVKLTKVPAVTLTFNQTSKPTSFSINTYREGSFLDRSTSVGLVSPSTIVASALVVLLVILALVICLSTAVHLSRTTKTRRRRSMRSDSRANNVTDRQHNSPGGDARSGLLPLSSSRGRPRLKNPHSQALLCLEDIRPRKVLNTTTPNDVSTSRQISPEGGATVPLNDVIYAGPPTILSSCKICRSCENDAEFVHAHCAEIHSACAEQKSSETFAFDEQERSFAFIV